MVELGVRALRLRGVMRESDGELTVSGDDRLLLLYYANSIAHHLSGRRRQAPAGAASSV